MTLPLPALVLALAPSLLTLAPLAQADIENAGGMRIGLRILVDCSAPAAARDRRCQPPAQRSDAPQPVPAQVSALSPAPENTAPDGAVAAVTVTY